MRNADVQTDAVRVVEVTKSPVGTGHLWTQKQNESVEAGSSAGGAPEGVCVSRGEA